MGHLYLLFACIIGFVMTWGVGCNDLANIMSTSMGSKSISVKQAMIIAIIFEFAGAFFGGTGVTNTIRTSIINIASLGSDVHILIEGMLAVLMAATSWMLLASYFGLPVSITHATIGSLVGLGAAVLGLHAIHWHQVKAIAISWIVSPLFACILAFALFNNVQRVILGVENPQANAKKYLPLYFFIVGALLSFFVIIKGLNHFQIHTSLLIKIIITLFSGLIIFCIGRFLIGKTLKDVNTDRRQQFTLVEKSFGTLMGFTACAMVFAHGSNDVSIAIGPIAIIYGIVEKVDLNAANFVLPSWLIFLGCTGVITGLLMYGRKVIETVGSNITMLTPSRAFCASLAAASTVVISTGIGIPVSATQTLVGAVLGVGLARGIGALNLSVIRNIFMSWIVTLPAASGLAIAYYYGLASLLG